MSSSTVTVSTTVANPIRTGVQGGLAWAVTEGLDAFHVIPMDERQYGVSIVILGIAFSFIQNVTENYLGKGFLRKVPEADVPVVDTTPKSDEQQDPGLS